MHFVGSILLLMNLITAVLSDNVDETSLQPYATMDFSKLNKSECDRASDAQAKYFEAQVRPYSYEEEVHIKINHTWYNGGIADSAWSNNYTSRTLYCEESVVIVQQVFDEIRRRVFCTADEGGPGIQVQPIIRPETQSCTMINGDAAWIAGDVPMSPESMRKRCGCKNQQPKQMIDP